MKRTFISFQAICLILIAAATIAISSQAAQGAESAQLYFTENEGQWPDDVKFRCDADGAIVWICKNRIVYQLVRRIERPDSNRPSDSDRIGDLKSLSTEQLIVTARLVGSNPDASFVGTNEMVYRCNYFLGADSSKWRGDVRNYQSAILRDIYPGVDLTFFPGNDGSLNYRYDLATAAASEQIRIEYEGIESTSTDELGRFVAATRFGEMAGLLASPGAATNSSLARLSTPDGDESLPAFDSYETRFRSPQAVSLIYSTYLGGSDIDYSWDLAIDKDGNAYVVGQTYSSDFPHYNAYDSTFDGGFGDIVVSKLSANGSSRIYSTYLGGSHIDASQCIAVDSTGAVFVAGSSSSTDYPTQNAYDASNNASQDVVVTKLNSAGNGLVYSTYLGGTSQDTPFSIAIDKLGSAYVTGETFSSNYPFVNAYDVTLAGQRDVFVTKMSSAGNTLVYSTILGGSDIEVSRSIAVDGSGAAYITGQTNSFNFPTQNAYDASLGGFGEDAFVTKLSAAGNTLVYSTYLGGSNDDWGYGIAVDTSGRAYVTGGTYSSSFPKLNAFDSIYASNTEDGFVTKFSSAGNTLVYSTYLGAAQRDRGVDIEVDASGSAYVTGITNSTGFPTRNAFDSTANGDDDAFVTRLSPGGNSLVYSTYLGGVNLDTGIELEINLAGNVYLCGNTWSANFPKVNAIDTTLGGLQDGYIVKLFAEGNAITGDCDQNGQIDVTDAVYLINYIFAGGPAPSQSVGDVDCSQQIDVTDAVYLINYIFAGGPAPGAACP